MVKTVENLTNIRLTESDTDGIWLHFEAGDYSAGVVLSSLLGHGDITNRTIETWAREQLDKHQPLPSAYPQNELLKEQQEKRTSKFSRPSRSVEGGY